MLGITSAAKRLQSAKSLNLLHCQLLNGGTSCRPLLPPCSTGLTACQQPDCPHPSLLSGHKLDTCVRPVSRRAAVVFPSQTGRISGIFIDNIFPYMAHSACEGLRFRSSVATMKAIVVSTTGGPEVLQLAEVPTPEVKPGEVLVRVAATALNRADTLQRQGNYPPPTDSSEYPGLECSGIIELLGEGVVGWRVGDQVCALLAGGGYAEKVAVPAGQLLPIPRSLSLQEAASLPEVACTVWSTVFMTMKLKAGETFLVHGGSSGIGTFAIQLAKAKGAQVFCTAGTAEKLARCKDLGADVVINYREEDFVLHVKEETGGRGVDVILDIMGGSYLSRNLRALAVGGRLFVIGLQGGRVGEVDLGAMLAKRLTVSAAGLRNRPQEQKNEIVSQVKDHVWPEIEAGLIKPVIFKVLPLAESMEGHRVMEESSHVGKIVFTV